MDDSIPKRSPSSREGYDKILEGLGQLGFDVDDDNFARHRGARGERASTSSSTTRSK